MGVPILPGSLSVAGAGCGRGGARACGVQGEAGLFPGDGGLPGRTCSWPCRCQRLGDQVYGLMAWLLAESWQAPKGHTQSVLLRSRLL